MSRSERGSELTTGHCDLSGRTHSVSGGGAPFRPPRAAYIHVPFCRRRCDYCDFTLVVGRDGMVRRYVAALEFELGKLREPVEVDTLFLGGGTPTHLEPQDLQRLLELLLRWFRLTPGGEFSVEANPLDLLDEGREEVMRAAGVNRISIGAQSFQEDELRLLSRDHHGQDICEAVARIRSWIPNLSLDLIFGVPGQTLESWRDNLERALALRPQHLSTYGLTIEKGTRFWSLTQSGRLRPLSEDLETRMYEMAMDFLPAGGFHQYELSNFAQPGWECRHNQTYWAGATYHGFGPGAARYLNGTREVGHRSTTTWLQRVEAGEDPVGYRETLSDENRAREALILGLRRARGVCRQEFLEAQGADLDKLGGATWSKLVAAGWVEATDRGYRLTRAGRLLADNVTVELVGIE